MVPILPQTTIPEPVDASTVCHLARPRSTST